MTLKEALKSIEQLEARVKQLEAQPIQHVHHHYPLNPAVFRPIMAPQYPAPPWEITCTDGIGNVSTGGANLTFSDTTG